MAKKRKRVSLVGRFDKGAPGLPPPAPPSSDELTARYGAHPRTAMVLEPAPGLTGPDAGGYWRYHDRDVCGDVAIREVLGFAVHLIPGLPKGSTLIGEHAGERFVWSTSEGAYRDAVGAGLPAFTKTGFLALSRGAQAGRVVPADLGGWMGRKRRNPRFRLSEAVVFEGYPVQNAPGLSWTLGEVFGCLEARLVGVEAG